MTKINKFDSTIMYIGQNEIGLYSKSNHGARDLELDALTIIPRVVMVI